MGYGIPVWRSHSASHREPEVIVDRVAFQIPEIQYVPAEERREVPIAVIGLGNTYIQPILVDGRAVGIRKKQERRLPVKISGAADSVEAEPVPKRTHRYARFPDVRRMDNRRAGAGIHQEYHRRDDIQPWDDQTAGSR